VRYKYYKKSRFGLAWSRPRTDRGLSWRTCVFHGALSARIGQAIQRRCKTQLSKYDGKVDAGRMWAAVRQLTGQQATPVSMDGITAEILNRHYADISTDPQYTEPVLKQLTDATLRPPQCISEGEMFHMLDTLRPTSAGLDEHGTSRCPHPYSATNWHISSICR